MTEINPAYSNHSGSTIDGAGNIFAIITQDGPSSGDTDVIVKRCLATDDPSLADSWKEVKRWTERTDGKPGYGTAEVRRDGLFVAILSQRNPNNETVTMVRTATGIAEPWSDAPAGAGGFIQAPGGALTLLSAALDKNTSIDLAAHNVPPATCYSIQVQVAAPAAGRRACVGAAGPAYAMITATAQAPNVEISSCGALAVPGGVLSVVVDSGPVARCEVYILGWWY